MVTMKIGSSIIFWNTINQMKRQHPLQRDGSGHFFDNIPKSDTLVAYLAIGFPLKNQVLK